MRKKGEENRKTMRALIMILYFFCVLNTAEISLNLKTAAEVVGDVEEEEIAEESHPEKKRIALTFDDGPGIYTEKLLEGLSERQVKATFFVLGEKVEENLELTGKISEEGHLIGNHTYSHVELHTMSDGEAREELDRTSNAVFKATGKFPEYMRPPYGACTERIEDSTDMILVRWTIDPLDWKIQNVDEIVRKVVTEAGENDIILLHDCYNTSVEAALKIVDTLKKKNFEFVTVDELYLN